MGRSSSCGAGEDVSPRPAHEAHGERRVVCSEQVVIAKRTARFTVETVSVARGASPGGALRRRDRPAKHHKIGQIRRGPLNHHHGALTGRGLAQRAWTAARMMAERSAFGIFAHLASPPSFPIATAPGCLGVARIFGGRGV